MNTRDTSQRLERIDILRGSAIVLMILFHLNYSLVHIFDSEILNLSEYFWFFLGKISALSFIFLAGFSYFLAEQKYGKKVKQKYLRYAVILGFFALCISFFTYFLFPEQFIAFGILHFFALSFLLLPYFTRLWYWIIPLAGAIILSGAYFFPVVESAFFFPLGFRNIEFFSADYYPLFPYFGVLLLGYVGARFSSQYWLLKYLSLSRKIYFWERGLIYLGKRSLLVYLIHQPIIIWVLFVLQYLWVFGN